METKQTKKKKKKKIKLGLGILWQSRGIIPFGGNKNFNSKI